jgi:hypothetical protein
LPDDGSRARLLTKKGSIDAFSIPNQAGYSFAGFQATKCVLTNYLGDVLE